MSTVALTDDPQNRLIVTAATLSGKPAARAAHRGHVAHSLVGGIHATRGDVLDLNQGYPDAFTGAPHRHPEQIVLSQMR